MAKGARIYTLNLFDELTSNASGTNDLARLRKLIADGRLDGQVEFEGSWREPAAALDVCLSVASGELAGLLERQLNAR